MDVATPLPSEGAVAPATRRSRASKVLRWASILCFVGAIGLGSYLAWVLWGTGIETSRAQEALRTQIVRTIPHAQDGGDPDARIRVPANFDLAEGSAMGIIQIPKIDLDMVVVEGTSTQDLKKGPGHYVGTAYPWDEHGRVGIAGHRTTYLHPFWSLDRLHKGDLVRLVTRFGTFDYRVTGTRVILPTEAWVLDQTKRPTLVMTACTPRFSASHRLVVFAARE